MSPKGGEFVTSVDGLFQMWILVDILMVWLSREELQSIQRELEVLSEQYSQKCLENAHLAQALEAERQALRQCQRENQELNAHNQVWMHTHICTYNNISVSVG